MPFNNSKIYFPVLFIIVIFSIWLRLPYLSVPVLIVDESLYAETANIIIEGGLPYKDAWDQKPPGIYYLYAAVFKVFGNNNMYAIHLAAAIAVAMTTALMYFIGKSLSCNLTGVLSALSYAILASAGQASQFQAANTEVFSVFFMTTGVLFFFLAEKFIYYKKINTKLSYFLSGIFMSLSFAFKQQVAGVILILFIYILIKNYLITRKLAAKTSVWNIVFILCGFLPIPIITIIYFLYKNALYDLWLIGIKQNFIYMGGNNLAHGVYTALKNIPFFIQGNYIFYLSSKIQFLVCIFTAVKTIKKHNLNFDNDNSAIFKKIFIVLWYVFSWACVGLGWRFEGHYFFFAFPAISFLSSDFWVTIFNSIKSSSHKYKTVFLAVPALVFSLAVTYSLIIHCGFPPGYKKIYFTIMDKQNQAGFPIKKTAKYINKNTTKNDKIFVWGLCPEIYTLSNRRCANRFIYTNFLIGMMTGDKYFYQNKERLDRIIPGSWELLMSDLTKTPPKFIIDTSPSNYFQYARYPISRFKPLMEFISKNYIFDKRVGNIDVYRLKDKI